MNDEGECEDELRREEVLLLSSDGSDDDCVVVDGEGKRQGDEKRKKPSDINAKRATTDGFEIEIKSPMTSNQNDVNFDLKVLTPSTINAGRSTLNCFDSNDNATKLGYESATKPKVSRKEMKDIETTNNKANDNGKNNVVKTKDLSGQKSTTDQSQLALLHHDGHRKSDSSNEVPGKTSDLKIRQTVPLPQHVSNVDFKGRQNDSASSRSIIKNTTESLATDVQIKIENEQYVGRRTINDDDSNKIDSRYDKSAQFSVNAKEGATFDKNSGTCIKNKNFGSKDPRKSSSCDDKITATESNASTSTPNVTESISVINKSSSVDQIEKDNPRKSGVENPGPNSTIPFYNIDLTDADYSEKEKRKIKREISDNESTERHNNYDRSPPQTKRVRMDENKQSNRENGIDNSKIPTELCSTTTILQSLRNKPSTSRNSAYEIINDNAIAIHDTNKSGSDNNATINEDNNYSRESKSNSEPQGQSLTKLNNSRNSTEEDLASQLVDVTLSEIKNENTSEISTVLLSETSKHAKEQQSDENPDIVCCDVTKITTIINKNQNVLRMDNNNQNMINRVNKQFECKICKLVLYSIYAAKKHRSEIHGNLNLRNKKLFNVKVNKKLDLGENHDETATINQENKQESSRNRNEMQQVNRAGQSKPKFKTMYKCRVCHELLTGYGCRKHRKTHPEFNKRRLFYKVLIREEHLETSLMNLPLQQIKQESGSSDSNVYSIINELKDADDHGSAVVTFESKDGILQANAETISESDADFLWYVSTVYESSNEAVVQSNANIINERLTEDSIEKVSTVKRDGSRSQTNAHQATKQGTSYDNNVDVVEDTIYEEEILFPVNIDFQTNKVPNTDTAQNYTDPLKSKVEDELNIEQTQSEVITQQNDTNECEGRNIPDIKDMKTGNELYVFQCEDCKITTDVYDDVIPHCQNHYNNITDTSASCRTCKLTYATSYLQTHGHVHEKDIKIIKYSYKSLLSNWDDLFDDIPGDKAKKMRSESIYKTFCVKMRVTEEGPWQYTLYQCRQCKTNVPLAKLQQHCQKRCSNVAYQCSLCKKHFTSQKIRYKHEINHEATRHFKVVEFNGENDQEFNFQLFEAHRLAKESMAPIKDLYKCQCDIYFTTNEAFKRHFVGCEGKSGSGVNCKRCTVPRFFETAELEKHLQMHHNTVQCRFRVNRFVTHQEIERFECERYRQVLNKRKC